MNGILYFTASWCVPCKKTKPIVQQLNEQHGGIFSIIDVDEQGSVASSYNIMSVPTFVLIENGLEIERYVGAKNEAQLKEMLDKVL